MRTRAAVAAALQLAFSDAISWPSPAISWWYAADNNWPQVISMISPFVGNATTPTLVTSVQSYCGYEVCDDGSVCGGLSSACAAFFPAAAALGVRNELNLDSGNCSIAAYRTLWADTTASPGVLLAAALAANATGWNIDLEPQADNCKGNPTGTAADAVAFAAWLTAVRDVLTPHGIRLTVDVADWSPVLSAFSTLAPAVDRLQDMETYNGDSEAEWLTYYAPLRAVQPRSVAGVGLGCWEDGKGAWWETPAGAAAKISRAIADGMPELALFRLDPDTGGAAWPPAFWWSALQAFAAPRL